MNRSDSMNTGGEWTDLDLERFADDAMDEGAAGALREALLIDSGLRGRLAIIQRTDRLVAEAFDRIANADEVALPPRAIGRARLIRPIALAACVALLTVGSYLIGRGGRTVVDSGAPLAQSPIGSGPGSPERAAPSRGAVRTVFELRLPAGYGGAGEPTVASADQKVGDADIGDPAPARQKADRAREREILALGRAIRSADLARATLDAMAGEDQLDACRVWARDPSLRPVAFERLARLQDDPAFAAECARIATVMSEDRSLLAWARSHNLRTDAGQSTHQ